MRRILKPNIFYLLVIILFAFSFNSSAQDYPEDQNSFWKNVRFGGGLGLGFGDGFFTASLSPIAIYQLNPSFGLGVGLNGSYASSRNQFKSTIIGASVLGMYSPLREIQLSAEFEELNVSRNFDDRLGLEDQNYWYPALFLGAGYNTGNVVIGIRYDVLYDRDKSIYGEPWVPFFRVFF